MDIFIIRVRQRDEHPFLCLIAGKYDAIGDVPILSMPSKIRANIGFT